MLNRSNPKGCDATLFVERGRKCAHCPLVLDGHTRYHGAVDFVVQAINRARACLRLAALTCRGRHINSTSPFDASFVHRQIEDVLDGVSVLHAWSSNIRF